MIINSIISGNSGLTASIFVTGLSETDTVTATKDGKTYSGKWVSEEAEVPYEIPVMTSNTTPSGVVSTNYPSSTHLPYFAFDADTTNVAFVNTNSSSISDEYLQYDFGNEGVSISEISITYSNVGAGVLSGSIYFEASIDGIEWEQIGDSIDISLSGNSSTKYNKTINVDNNKIFKSVRLKGSTKYSYSPYAYMLPNIYTLQVYGTTTVTKQGFLIENLSNYGTYTITATNGTNTATQDVLVDIAIQFDVEMTI